AAVPYRPYVANRLRAWPHAFGPASRREALLPAFAPCRSRVDKRRSTPGNGGSAGVAAGLVGVGGGAPAAPGAAAPAHCHHHQEASFANSLSVPTPRHATLHNLPPTPASSPLADACSLLVQVPKILRGEPPTATLELNMAKAGSFLPRFRS